MPVNVYGKEAAPDKRLEPANSLLPCGLDRPEVGSVCRRIVVFAFREELFDPDPRGQCFLYRRRSLINRFFRGRVFPAEDFPQGAGLRIGAAQADVILKNPGPFRELFPVLRRQGLDNQALRVRGGRFPLRPVAAPEDCVNLSPGKV